MVGYLCAARERRLWVKTEPMRLYGLPVLAAVVPAGKLRRLDRGAKALARAGCRRVLVEPELDCPELPGILARRGLALVDVLPLCLAKAPALTLALVEELPLRRRCVLLRGEEGRSAWSLAAALCPQVGQLLLDFRRGGEDLSRRLQAIYGAACLSPDQGPPPSAVVELSPCAPSEGRVLKLWGEPELCGLTLTAEGEDVPLPVLSLLWETGWVELEEVRVRRAKEP